MMTLATYPRTPSEIPRTPALFHSQGDGEIFYPIIALSPIGEWEEIGASIGTHGTVIGAFKEHVHYPKNGPSWFRCHWGKVYMNDMYITVPKHRVNIKEEWIFRYPCPKRINSMCVNVEAINKSH